MGLSENFAAGDRRSGFKGAVQLLKRQLELPLLGQQSTQQDTGFSLPFLILDRFFKGEAPLERALKVTLVQRDDPKGRKCRFGSCFVAQRLKLLERRRRVVKRGLGISQT